jgi:hypothetical protein
LRTDADTVSETLCFLVFGIPDEGQSKSIRIKAGSREMIGQLQQPPALDRRLGGPQIRCGHCEKENNFALVGIRTSIVQLVALFCTD